MFRAVIKPKSLDFIRYIVEFMAENTNTYAIISSGGKQYKVQPGSRIKVEKLDAEVGSKVTLENVLLTGTGEGNDPAQIQVGTPYVNGAKVTAKVLAHDLEKKIIIFKKIRRTGYMKKQGHRQELTHLMIESVGVN